MKQGLERFRKLLKAMQLVHGAGIPTSTKFMVSSFILDLKSPVGADIGQQTMPHSQI